MLLPHLWKVISTDYHFVLYIPLTYNKYSKDNVSEVKYPLIVSSSFEVEPRVESWERVVGQYSSSKKKLENHLTPFLFSIKWKLFLWHCKKIHFCWIRNNIHYFKQHVPFERTYGLVKLFLTWKILLVKLRNGEWGLCTMQCTLGSYCSLPKNWYWFSQ